MADFSPEAKQAGKNMLWYWPLGGEMEVVSGICLLLRFGHISVDSVAHWSLYWSSSVTLYRDMLIIILSNIQYKLWGSILCFQNASRQPAAPAVLLL